MMKINSACEFGDSLDFDKLIESTDSFLLSQPRRCSSELHSQQSSQYAKTFTSEGRNLYHLHAILCHSGSLHRGHYYSFLRVGKPQETLDTTGKCFDDGSWIKFNDQNVVPTFRHVAIGTGQGGYNTTYKCYHDDPDDSEEEENNKEAQKATKSKPKPDTEMLDLQDLLSDVDEEG